MSDQHDTKPGANGPDAFERALEAPTTIELVRTDLRERRNKADAKARAQQRKLIEALRDLRDAVESRIQQLECDVLPGTACDRIRHATDTAVRSQQLLRENLIEREAYERALLATMEPEMAPPAQPAHLVIGHRRAVEASELGLKPGEWPRTLNLEVEPGSRQPFRRDREIRTRGMLTAYIYRSAADRTITVFND